MIFAIITSTDRFRHLQYKLWIEMVLFQNPLRESRHNFRDK